LARDCLSGYGSGWRHAQLGCLASRWRRATRRGVVCAPIARQTPAEDGRPSSRGTAVGALDGLAVTSRSQQRSFCLSARIIPRVETSTRRGVRGANQPALPRSLTDRPRPNHSSVGAYQDRAATDSTLSVIGARASFHSTSYREMYRSGELGVCGAASA